MWGLPGIAAYSRWGTDMTRTVVWTVVGAVIFALDFSFPLHAQSDVINDIKAKISNAELAQQTFAKGLTHCSELNGTNFYFAQRDRVLNLEDYHRSVANLALQQAFNPETKQPWTKQDADAHWEQAKAAALAGQANCALVANLPDLQKKLEDLQKQAASDTHN
jgi:hypothetical protein